MGGLRHLGRLRRRWAAALRAAQHPTQRSWKPCVTLLANWKATRNLRLSSKKSAATTPTCSWPRTRNRSYGKCLRFSPGIQEFVKAITKNIFNGDREHSWAEIIATFPLTVTSSRRLSSGRIGVAKRYRDRAPRRIKACQRTRCFAVGGPTTDLWRHKPLRWTAAGNFRPNHLDFDNTRAVVPPSRDCVNRIKTETC